jgi:rod shape-determining protein MreD
VVDGVRIDQGDAETVTRLLFAILLAVLAVAQSTVLSTVGLLGLSPNLVLVLILVWSSRYGAREGVVWAFGAGIMLDLLALDPLGSNALALIVVAVIGSLAQKPLLQSGLVLPMFMVLVATLASFLVASSVDAILGSGYSFLVSVRLGVVTAFLNALVVPPVYGLIVMLDRLGVSRVAPA